MQLIVNADDFGYSKGVNLGIIEAYQNGVVRSTTLLSGMAGFDHAVALYRENPGLGVGVHLMLTAGPSTGGVYRSITDETGRFFPLEEAGRRFEEGAIDSGEIEREFRAQIKKVLEAGIVIDHIDCHHHMHDLYPEVMAIFLRLGEEYGLKGRICRPGFAHEKLLSTSAFSDAFYGDNATEEGFLEILENHSCESLEIMCHPAYVDSELYHGTSYNIPRVEELRILTSPAVKKYIAERGIELIHFAGLGA